MSSATSCCGCARAVVGAVVGAAVGAEGVAAPAPAPAPLLPPPLAPPEPRPRPAEVGAGAGAGTACTYTHQYSTQEETTVSWFGLFYKNHKTKFVTTGGTYASHLLPMHCNFVNRLL